ncbi:MAG TPA: HAMP domain-containing sensor histidine kinase [Stellaceae bacterium]|nr:HAMP domain-containing sensor histidine kinase [Stellaceae bacterium]
MALKPAAVFPLLDWFIPERLRADAATHRRARLYLVTHLIGPPLGFMLSFGLYVLDPHPGAALWLLTALEAAFLLYPFLLRALGSLAVLAPISVQHFTFVILFGSFQYGGVSSPFFPWLGIVPLAAAFYLTGRLRILALLLVCLQILGFYMIHALGFAFPEHVPAATLAPMGIMSALCTCIFVSIMALYNARIVAGQQEELEREVESHRMTEAKLRRAKEDAERADRAKSAFLANTSHELRTPLNAIIGFAEVIRSETFGRIDNPRYLDYLKDIYDSGRHLLRIINDILDLSKIEAGKATLDREERVELAAVIEAPVRMMLPQAQADSIRIVLDLEPALPLVIGSERMLQQVFINLLSNAVKFTPSRGVVTVHAHRTSEGGVVVVIADSGIGMTDADIDLAMTVFGQVDNDLARRYSGTGLGLPLAKAIVELHRGTLEIDSYPGRGTTVTVTLPQERVWQGEPMDAAADAVAVAGA